jgi:hypothetical protein
MRTLILSLFCFVFQWVATEFAIARQDSPVTDATSALACIQNALGGTAAFAAVSSLYITGATSPSQDSGLRPIPTKREISVVFPDRYLRADSPSKPGYSVLSSVVGFNKAVILNRPGHPDARLNENLARQDFARQLLMRFPREMIGVRLQLRVTKESGRERLAVEASGTDSFKATLLADLETCVPVAVQYTPWGAATGGVRRVELSQYRRFGGVQFPTVLKTTVGGQLQTEEHVTTVELNTPTAAAAFASRR